MQSSHAAARVSARFDDPNLVGYGGLAPVVRLAERCGLPALAGEHVRLPVSKDGTGAFPAAKLMSLVGGMVAGADSIDDMDRLRHGALPRLFAGVRAPSTLGSFLRSFTHGHVKQLHAVARRFLPELAAHTGLLSGAESVAHVDIDDTIRRTYGYAKQGAGYGYSKVKGLNTLLGIVSTPLSAPKATFAEQVTGLTVRYQRRTPALQHVVNTVAVAPAGSAGARLLTVLHCALSWATVLTCLMRIPVPMPILRDSAAAGPRS